MRILRRYVCLSALVAFSAFVALGVGQARAQQYPYFDTSDPNVVIDLSVLNDGGYGEAPAAGAPLSHPTTPYATPGQRLLVPGARLPVSRLAVPSMGGKITLKKPGSKPAAKPAAKIAKRPTRKSKPPEQKIAKAPPKPRIAKAPPPPPPAAKPKPAPKAPVAAPMKASPKPMELAKAPPPPPPPPAAVKAPPAPPPVAVKAPMPPPPVKMEKAPETAAVAPAKAPPAKQQASLPATGGPLSLGRVMQVGFGQNDTKLPTEAKENLKSLAARMKGKDNLRLQLLAYAGGGSLTSSKARRMSLSRALSVRSYLIEIGVRSTRIDVRALGDKTTEKPVNRVDLNVVER